MADAKLTKVACVTGSAKRIGAAIVNTLHAQGYAVVIHCNHSLVDAQTLATELNTLRPNSAKLVQADLSDMAVLPLLAEEILACFGRLDVLVHNASRFYPTELDSQLNSKNNSTTDSNFQQWQYEWDELFASNAKAPFFLTQLLRDALSVQKGSVISLLDIHAHDRPFAGYAIYNMAKAAHRMMVKSLSLDYAPDIRVNGVAPGANVWPDESSDQAITQYTQNSICQAIPMQRVGQPQDIADAVAYLAQANYVTGHVINVDGGRSLTLAGSS